MDKKGVELSFNVIIIAILVILVLVIVGAFFAGGVTKLIGTIFGTAPDELSTATSTCSSQCSIAQSSAENAKKNSGYCTKWFKFDNDNDGQIDQDIEGNVKRYYCYNNPIGLSCPGVEEVEGCKRES